MEGRAFYWSVPEALVRVLALEGIDPTQAGPNPITCQLHGPGDAQTPATRMGDPGPVLEVRHPGGGPSYSSRPKDGWFYLPILRIHTTAGQLRKSRTARKRGTYLGRPYRYATYNPKSHRTLAQPAGAKELCRVVAGQTSTCGSSVPCQPSRPRLTDVADASASRSRACPPGEGGLVPS